MMEENNHCDLTSKFGLSQFFGDGESVGCFHILVADLLDQKCAPKFHYLLYFWKFLSFWSICSHSQHWWILFCICSLVRRWGSYLKQTCRSCKLLCRMQNIDFFEELIIAALSWDVIRRFFCIIAPTLLIFPLFTTLSGRPSLVDCSADERIHMPR